MATITDHSEAERMRVVSWNVNGIRACVRHGFVGFVDRSAADIVGVQEVRAARGPRSHGPAAGAHPRSRTPRPDQQSPDASTRSPDSDEPGASRRSPAASGRPVAPPAQSSPSTPLKTCVALLNRLRGVSDYLRFNSSLPPRLSELVILITAREWSQNYEWAAHHRLALEGGLSPDIAAAVAGRFNRRA